MNDIKQKIKDLIEFFNIVRHYRKTKLHLDLTIFLYKNEQCINERLSEEKGALKVEIKDLKKEIRKLKKELKK